MNRWLLVFVLLAVAAAATFGMVKYLKSVAPEQYTQVVATPEPTPEAEAEAEETTATEETSPGPEGTPAESAAPTPDPSIARSKIGLRLFTVVLAPAAKQSIAVLESKDGKTRYGVVPGDRLDKSGPLVKEILADRILISHRGKVEFIPLEAEAASSFTKAPALSEFKEAGLVMQGSTVTTNLDYMKETMRKQFRNILLGAHIEPAIVGGKIRGFQITQLRSDSIHRKLGLQDGDIIESANGQTLTSPEQIIELARDLRRVPRVEVEVNRGGQIIRKTVIIRY